MTLYCRTEPVSIGLFERADAYIIRICQPALCNLGRKTRKVNMIYQKNYRKMCKSGKVPLVLKDIRVNTIRNFTVSSLHDLRNTGNLVKLFQHL